MSFKMDNIPSHPTILEDSGVASTSSSLITPAFESTPNPPFPPSRKRKHPLACGRPSTSPFFPMSSTLNESTISTCFERWNISSFTPNFYVEHASGGPSPDKIQRSEPATPVKEPEETPFYRSHADSFHKTPTKHAPSQQRLGSPECNEILYGGEIRSNSVLGLKIEKGKQRHSPAKKRLFKSAEFETRRRNLSRQHAKVDPVRFLVKDRRLDEVLSTILDYLSAADLRACVKVNSEWREAVWSDESSARRLRLDIANFRRDKENCFNRRSGCGVEVASSPAKQTVCLYYKIGSMLQEGQRLDKCPACTYAAIVDKSIGQCQNDSCGYIYCLSCGSCSTTGPENFTDGCKQSGLVVARPPRHPLLPGSPDRDRPEPPRDSLSFLLDSSSSKLDSSGYVSDLENSSAFHKSRSYSSPLADYNRDLPGARPMPARRNSFVPVVTLNMPKRKEIMEPSSPPKIPNVACSAKSKKNLRRLIRN